MKDVWLFIEPWLTAAKLVGAGSDKSVRVTLEINGKNSTHLPGNVFPDDKTGITRLIDRIEDEMIYLDKCKDALLTRLVHVSSKQTGKES
jgi:hypothetical protein